MTAGPDGHLWFVENFGNRLGEFDARTGTFTEYPIPSRNSSPVRITADAYGNLWFTEANTNKVGEFTIATHRFAEYAIPTANSSPYDITTNSGGIWFTEQSGNSVGNLSHGTITEYKVPTKNSDPVGMAPGANGAIWFAEYVGRKIGRLDARAGTFTEYPIPGNGIALELTAGAGDNTWFTVVKSDAIGKITDRGEITEFQIPTPLSGPFAIGIGPDDAVWFAERGANKIARLTLQGRVTNEFSIPTADCGAHSIVSGPNHDVWFTEFTTNKVASITTK